MHVPITSKSAILESDGCAIGLADEPYEERIVKLIRGDRLFLYSDGLPEALNAVDEPFGNDRLVAATDRSRSLPLQAAVDALVEETVQWRGSAHSLDDLSVLAFELSDGG